MKKNVVTNVLAGVFVLGSAACGSDNGGTTVDARPADAPPVSGSYTHYATNAIAVSPAASYALDINGTGPKNKIGGVLDFAKTTFGLDVGPIITESVQSGALVLLHSVRATSLSSAATATWQVYIGEAFTNAQLDAGMGPDFSGSGTFVIDTSAGTGLLTGSITGGHFTGGPGEVSVQLALVGGAPPITLNLKSARIVGDVTADGCMNGIVGGGVLFSEIQGQIIPAVAGILDGAIKANGCTTLTNCPTTGAVAPCTDNQCSIAGAFDTNPKNGSIVTAEVATVVGALLAPDLDLDGNSVSEATSVGIGFTCVKANFTASNEQ